MDFLDLDTTNKKSNRMRSWYLYEQYRSLERNQLEATRKLKDRSYQERILRRELSERKARRNLYDKFGHCQSESRIERCETKPSLTMSAGNKFIETFSEYQDDQIINNNEREVSEDAFSQDDSIPDKNCMDDFKSVEESKADSYLESVNSVVENIMSEETICDDIREEIELTRKDIADDISKQLDSVQENIKFLENISKLHDDDKISDLESLHSITKRKLKKGSMEDDDSEYSDPDNNNIIAMWSRLVSFAYQVIQLNRGNCYYDYSFQFLTAVLACDVLRRGVNRMCDILQPYVSPIKFAPNVRDACSDSCKNVKCKKSIQPKKSRKTFDNKLCPINSRKFRTKNSVRKYSDECWQHYDRNYENQTIAKRRYASEPWRSVAKITFNKDLLSPRSSRSSDSLWPVDLKTKYSKISCCCCRKKAVNPMLKIARYIDSILQDIDETKHTL